MLVAPSGAVCYNSACLKALSRGGGRVPARGERLNFQRKDLMAKSKKLADGTGLVEQDPWLAPHADALRHRWQHYMKIKESILKSGGLLGPISQGHTYFGFNRGELDGQKGVWYREWAPGATALGLLGDFNGWDCTANPLTRDEYGVWSVFLPDARYGDRLRHESRVKVRVQSAAGAMDRIPAYIRRVVQDAATHDFVGQYWHPEHSFEFLHASPDARRRPGGLRIYEAHVGMALEEARVGTYAEFTRHILPRIHDLRYNAIQLMAIMEHPFYGSFGYHVSNLFAPSSRFGTPEELKGLIDTAHGMGISVLLDVVHSHAIKNLNEARRFLGRCATGSATGFTARPTGREGLLAGSMRYRGELGCGMRRDGRNSGRLPQPKTVPARSQPSNQTGRLGQAPMPQSLGWEQPRPA